MSFSTFRSPKSTQDLLKLLKKDLLEIEAASKAATKAADAAKAKSTPKPADVSTQPGQTCRQQNLQAPKFTFDQSGYDSGSDQGHIIDGHDYGLHMVDQGVEPTPKYRNRK